MPATPTISVRALRQEDLDAVADLSVDAWAPVFASLEEAMGTQVFRRLHPDWRTTQRRSVLNACTDPAGENWVGEIEGDLAGFVSLRLHQESAMGEIFMVAVAPGCQHLGMGSRLIHVALDRFKDAGMTVAMVETGGDPGHAPARRAYERAGFIPLPIARYFQAL